jgi:glycosyltransferase involved in cell wall biosynthesis
MSKRARFGRRQLKGKMPLRILHITPYFSPRLGGAAYAVYQLARSQEKQGHAVTILTSNFGFRDCQFPEARFPVVSLPNLIARWGFYVTPGLPAWLQAHMQGFDVIHLHTIRTFQNIFAHHYAVHHNIPYSISAHGTLLISPQMKRAKKIFDMCFGNGLIQDASRWIAVSPLEEEQYRRMGIQNKKIRLAYNGIDFDEFSLLPEKGKFRNTLPDARVDTKIILFLGRIHPLKNIGILMEAFSLLCSKLSNCMLVLAGPDDGDLARLQRFAHRLGCANQVRFVGALYGPDRLAALVDADVLAHPPDWEIFGFVVFEALMCGTPVVVNAESGAGKMVHAAHAGYVFPPGKVDEFASCLWQALADSSENKATIANGQSFIHRELDWGKAASQVETAYREMLAERQHLIPSF